MNDGKGDRISSVGLLVEHEDSGDGSTVPADSAEGASVLRWDLEVGTAGEEFVVTTEGGEAKGILSHLQAAKHKPNMESFRKPRRFNTTGRLSRNSGTRIRFFHPAHKYPSRPKSGAASIDISPPGVYPVRVRLR